jgi:hypothetical protein
LDSDSLSNLEEYQYGTDPLQPDTDGDNLNDRDEVLVYGTDPTNPDTDNDGASDGEEVALGSDPLMRYIYVDASASPGGDGTTPATAFQTIAGGNAVATSGYATIHVAAGIYNITAPIGIVGGVTYQGAGALTTTIDGGGAMRLFEAFGDGFTPDSGLTGWVIDGFTLTNGHATFASEVDDSGGTIILRNGASGAILDCVIKNSVADDKGGAISLNGNEGENPGDLSIILAVSDCVFDNNRTAADIGDDGGVCKADNNVQTTWDRCVCSKTTRPRTLPVSLSSALEPTAGP